MDKKYETYSHAKVHIRYHLIFSTKFRKECLTDISNDVRKTFLDISNRSKRFRVLEVGIDKNHLHLFVRTKPTISPTQIVTRLKSMSTYLLWKTHGEYLRKFYWKEKKLLWTKGYFCASVGEANEKTIEEYIRSQG